MQAEEARRMLVRPRPAVCREGALSTGSTLLNLACAESPDAGLLAGGYYYLVGDSASGKTWTSLSCFAEAVQNPFFKNYRLIFDNVEGGALMDLGFYFGKGVMRRVEPPSMRNGKPSYSESIESFYFHLQDALAGKRPFIYVLDSQDALSSSSAEKKFKEQRKAMEAGEATVGSYGDGKAKYHSEHLRHVLSGLRKTGSILVIIGQTRDNLGMSFDPKTRSGGRALRFYANLEIWTSVKEKIKKTIRGKERTIGIRCLAEVKKNRVSGKVGKDRSVEIPIYYSHGIDDVGACVDYLLSESHWETEKDETEEGTKKNRKKMIIDAKEFLFKGTREQLIAYVEEEGLETKLRKLVGRVWQEIEDECAIRRKRRYE